jgi:hypothetical protein
MGSPCPGPFGRRAYGPTCVMPPRWRSAGCTATPARSGTAWPRTPAKGWPGLACWPPIIPGCGRCAGLGRPGGQRSWPAGHSAAPRHPVVRASARSGWPPDDLERQSLRRGCNPCLSTCTRRVPANHNTTTQGHQDKRRGLQQFFPLHQCLVLCGVSFSVEAIVFCHLFDENMLILDLTRCPCRKSCASLTWERRAPARLQKPRWSVAIPGKTLENWQ